MSTASAGEGLDRLAVIRRSLAFSTPLFLAAAGMLVLSATGVFSESAPLYAGWITVLVLGGSPLATACSVWSLTTPRTPPRPWTATGVLLWALASVSLTAVLGTFAGSVSRGVALGAIAVLPQAILLIAVFLLDRGLHSHPHEPLS